jgi:hypothetical protein
VFDALKVELSPTTASMNIRIYLTLLIISIIAFPFVKIDLEKDTMVLQLDEDSLIVNMVPKKDLVQFFRTKTNIDQARVFKIPQDSVFLEDGQLHWGPKTEGIRKRVAELRGESDLFNLMMMEIEDTDFPFRIFAQEMPHAMGSFSPMQGELRFHTSLLDSFFFDATIIEEFTHAYQAGFYDYGHGYCRKEALQAAKAYGDPIDTKALTKSLAAWDRYGRRTAYIESEAKIISFLVQNQAKSISLQAIADTDDYNSGGQARGFLQRYFQRRNCLSILRPQRLDGQLDFYLDREHFWRYQKRFSRHWKRFDPNCKYAKGKYWHRPEALNALAEKFLEE